MNLFIALFIAAELLTAISASRLPRYYASIEEEIRYLQSPRQKRLLLMMPTQKCMPPLGCFSIDGVWASRGINVLPADRATVNTEFLLFTRKNPSAAQKLVAEDGTSIATSNFDGSKPTKIITHGFLESTNMEWFARFNAEFLKQGDYNVINVNWGGLGSSKTLYTQATANTRLVGAEIALLINALISKTGTTPADFHILGHSLGAHTAGYAGQRVKGIGRITGLDPAEPYFEGLSPEIRLDPSDALFVDVIHTDGNSILQLPLGKGGLGLKQPSGHADFYPNGGEEQPNCKNSVGDVFTNPKGIYEGAKNLVACDHARAIELFIYSINSCGFTAYSCGDYSQFLTAQCSHSCSDADRNGDKCNRMGLYAHKPQAAQVSYYLHSSGNEPYCATSYTVQIDVDPKSTARKGKMSVNIKGKSGTSGLILLTEQTTEFQPGQTYSFLVASPAEFGEVVGVEVKWQLDLDWWKVISKACFGLKICSSEIAVKRVSIKSENESRFSYCAGNTILPKDTLMTLQTANSC